MKPSSRLRVVLAGWLALVLVLPARPESPVARPPLPDLASSIRAHMDYLAGDALAGRGSGTPQEHLAAEYVASELRRYGVAPAFGNDGGYVEHVALEYRSLASPPVLSFEAGGQTVRWTSGKEIAVRWLADASISGPLQKLDPSDAQATVKAGAVVLLTSTDDATAWQHAYDISQRGAALVLVRDGPMFEDAWSSAWRRQPKLPPRIRNLPSTAGIQEMSMAVVRDTAFKTLSALTDGTTIRLEAKLNPVQQGETWNTVGMIKGADPGRRDEAVLFSAHIDHLGTKITSHGKVIYHGADDDASGVSAVLELARAMASGPPPRRTVLFAFFGSEERGGLGSTYFREFPPVPLSHIVAALEFEMLGRPDDSIPKHKLWLSGYERSDLGSELAAHGAPLVADPHLGEHFFERSDNYPLAKKGVVAHTVSSFGLHRDYHQPGDTLAHIDFPHLDEAVEEMIAPAEWLVNSNFRPHWVEKPGSRRIGNSDRACERAALH
ncbi:MAG TPA: M20/M25/M40 family metallo-hydrolase [Terriglobales bacterium]|nr:M20/M25/M40 family metallo-hydrolase [Terriglobales bacterium]